MPATTRRREDCSERHGRHGRQVGRRRLRGLRRGHRQGRGGTRPGRRRWSTTPASPATAMLHRMSFEQWSDVMRINLDACFNMAKAGHRRHARARLGPDRQHRLDQRPGRASTARPTTPRPRPASSASPRRWPRKARKRHHRQRHRARLHRHRDGAGGAGERCWRRSSPQIPVGRLGKAEEIARGVLPGRRRGRLRHRLDPVHQRRPAYVLSAVWYKHKSGSPGREPGHKEIGHNNAQ